MNVPSPSYREHLEFVPTALLAIPVLQYTGILGAPGEVNVVYFANLAIGIPIALYIQSVLLEILAGAHIGSGWFDYGNNLKTQPLYSCLRREPTFNDFQLVGVD
jgi:hypothetical protein